MIDTTGATPGQVLTFNNATTTWVASAAPNPNPAAFYTTVGNASAGIFAAAVCFIPSSPGPLTWTAPAGCYTARVTIVGGGGGTSGNGGRSHFNYPSGTTTAANQLYAGGGGAGGGGSGGSGGWNGINSIAVGGVGGSNGGGGGGGGGGYGGGGGSGGTGYGGSYGGGGGVSYGTSGGGSGGVNGNGSSVGYGGDALPLSYAATSLTNFTSALGQKVGRGISGGGGGAWCSAIVSVVPGQEYAYAVGAGGGTASYGMVVIEW